MVPIVRGGFALGIVRAVVEGTRGGGLFINNGFEKCSFFMRGLSCVDNKKYKIFMDIEGKSADFIYTFIKLKRQSKTKNVTRRIPASDAKSYLSFCIIIHCAYSAKVVV